MAAWLTSFKTKLETSTWGAVLMAALYAIMLLLVFLYFTGNGEFLYEI